MFSLQATLFVLFASGIDLSLSNFKSNVEARTGHVLLYHPWNTKSHRMTQNAILQGLLARGHQVTGVFPQHSDIRNENYTEIVVEDRFAKVFEVMTNFMMEKEATGILNFISLWPEFSSRMKPILKDVTEDNKMILEKLQQNKTPVSVVIFTSAFGWLGVDLINGLSIDGVRPGLVGLSIQGWAPHFQKALGNPENPSHQAELFYPAVEPMNFKDRLINTILYSQDYFLLGQYIYPYIFDMFEGINIESYIDVVNDMDLLFLASHFVTHAPQAWAPNTIEIGGIHCREGQPLPPDLKLFMDSHPEGVIYVSFGSTVKPSLMNSERKQIFIDTFRKLNMPILWKWDEDNIADLPKNVMIKKWVPQQDLLAHPNLKLFVTHGGLLSVQEALYHMKPLLGIPLGNDQKPNLLRAKRAGYAEILEWDKISVDEFYNFVIKMLQEENVQQNLKIAHERFVDQKESPQERAVWWVEYLIRNGKTGFLKPYSLQLEWYQYHLLDVIAFIFSTLLIVTVISISCCCFIIKKCCCKEKVKTE